VSRHSLVTVHVRGSVRRHRACVVSDDRGHQHGHPWPDVPRRPPRMKRVDRSVAELKNPAAVGTRPSQPAPGMARPAARTRATSPARRRAVAAVSIRTGPCRRRARSPRQGRGGRGRLGIRNGVTWRAPDLRARQLAGG
jgi:hypothetical protein